MAKIDKHEILKMLENKLGDSLIEFSFTEDKTRINFEFEIRKDTGLVPINCEPIKQESAIAPSDPLGNQLLEDRVKKMGDHLISIGYCDGYKLNYLSEKVFTYFETAPNGEQLYFDLTAEELEKVYKEWKSAEQLK